MSAVRIDQVSKSYGPNLVLDRVSLQIPDGSITSILGSSGCGKTTLLRIIAGFVRADSGTVSIDERQVETGASSVKPERRGVGYVPQEGALFPHLDVAANILFGLPRRHRSEHRLHQLLELAELDPSMTHRFPHELSGGQQQRVALARALAPAPRVVLLDEPFSSLDAALRVSAGRAVTRVLRQAGTTTVMVTHDQGEAMSLADQVAVMRGGRMVQVDTPDRLYKAPLDPVTAEFVGGASMLPGQAGNGLVATVLGSLPVADGVVGPVRVMIRPEQIELVGAGGGPRATVTEVSYFGPSVVVRLTLPDGTPLTARGPSAQPPTVGAIVGVAVIGSVLTFPEPAR